MSLISGPETKRLEFKSFDEEWPKGEKLIHVIEIREVCQHESVPLSVPHPRFFCKWEDLGRYGGEFERVYCSKCQSTYQPTHWKYKEDK